jgi:hypothetical protein
MAEREPSPSPAPPTAASLPPEELGYFLMRHRRGAARGRLGPRRAHLQRGGQLGFMRGDEHGQRRASGREAAAYLEASTSIEKIDIDERELRLHRGREPQGFGSRAGDAANLVASFDEDLLQVYCDKEFVFDHENFQGLHSKYPSSRIVGWASHGVFLMNVR